MENAKNFRPADDFNQAMLRYGREADRREKSALLQA